MSPLPVIANTYRVALNYQTADGISPVNIFHVGSMGDVTEVGDALNASMVDNMLAPVSRRYEPTSWTVTKLDGSSAGVIVPKSSGIQMCGFAEAAEVVIEGAYVCSFRSLQKGPQGRNRVFVGPIAEGATFNGLVDPSTRDEMIDSWLTFQAALQANTPFVEQLVVSYVHAHSYEIVSTSAMSNIGTQRRRLVAQR